MGVVGRESKQAKSRLEKGEGEKEERKRDMPGEGVRLTPGRQI